MCAVDIYSNVCVTRHTNYWIKNNIDIKTLVYEQIIDYIFIFAALTEITWIILQSMI